MATGGFEPLHHRRKLVSEPEARPYPASADRAAQRPVSPSPRGQALRAPNAAGDSLITEIPNGLRETVRKALLVVDDQHDCHDRPPIGRSRVKLSCHPSGARRRRDRHALPAISRTIARPSPCPSGRPVAKGSNRCSRMFNGTPLPESATDRRNRLSTISPHKTIGCHPLSLNGIQGSNCRARQPICAVSNDTCGSNPLRTSTEIARRPACSRNSVA